MNDFIVVDITSDNINKAIQVFAKAMSFPLDVELTILSDAKLFMNNNNLIGIGLQHNGSLVGFGALIGMNSSSAWIPYVGVEPNFQHSGGGKLLMEQLLSIASSYNWLSVELVASRAGLPLYKKFGFRSDFSISHFEITKTIAKSKTNLNTTIISKSDQLPSWVLDFDRKNLGIDRSNIFPLHPFESITLISQQNHGYGLLYGQKLGPIIADSPALARDIIVEGFNHGATSLILPINQNLLSFFNKSVQITMLPNRDGTKMTYGNEILVNTSSVYGFRSMAFG